MKNLVKSSKNFIVKNVKSHEIVLSILLFLYIFSGVKTPIALLPYINNYITYILFIVVAFIIIMFVNPQMGLLFSIAFYILFRRSSSTDNIESSESRKAETMAKVNGDSHIDLKFPKNSKGEIMETRDNSDILEYTKDGSIDPESIKNTIVNIFYNELLNAIKSLYEIEINNEKILQ